MKRSEQLLRACSFIGGSLIGAAVFLPVLAMDAQDGDLRLALLAALIMAPSGIVLHLANSTTTLRRAAACGSTLLRRRAKCLA